MMKINPRKLFVKKHIQYVVVGLLLLVLVFAYPCRGFIRNTFLPSAATVFYLPGLNKTTDDAAKELQSMYPFGRIKYIGNNKASCQRSDASRFKTEVDCNKYLFRGQVSIQGVSVGDFEAKAKTFESSLTAHGWSTGDSGGGVNHVYDPPYGWWYLAQYSKTVGKVKCDLSVQRDNDPNLLDADMICSRSVIFF
jgi:hypothetical protein